LMCCRGISSGGAQAILTALGGLPQVWGATMAELAAVQVGKQKFGEVKAKRLYELLHPVPSVQGP
jgi:hypothetical protein